VFEDNSDDEDGGSHQRLDDIMLTSCLDDLGRSDGVVESILECCRDWYNRRNDDRLLGYIQNLHAVQVAGKEASASSQ